MIEAARLAGDGLGSAEARVRKICVHALKVQAEAVDTSGMTNNPHDLTRTAHHYMAMAAQAAGRIPPDNERAAELPPLELHADEWRAFYADLREPGRIERDDR